jgi:hypothetical protein
MIECFVVWKSVIHIVFSFYPLSKVTGVAGGLFMGLARLAWYPDPYYFGHKDLVVDRVMDLKYNLNHLKRPVGLAVITLGIYSTVECIMESLRDEQRESTYVNAGVAGFATGMFMGSLTKRVDIMATTGLGLGFLMAMVEFNGPRMQFDTERTDAKSSIGPQLYEESDKLKRLKEQYPEYKDL